ncbi:MAG: hypothetical protein IPL79_10085 [Myxococcales bacterium]|nr:hypothetical protein [Myxococcales bacterium]
MARKRLGEMLLEARLINEDGLRAALSEQKRWGGPLGRFFVDLGLVSEDVLVQTLSRQLTLPIVDVTNINIHPTVLALVPAQFCHTTGVLPFSQPMKFLDVAMIDATNQSTIDALQVMTKLNVRPHLCGPRALEKAIGRFYQVGVSTARMTQGPQGPGGVGGGGGASGGSGWSDSFSAEETSSFEVMHTDGTRTKASRHGAQRLDTAAGSSGLAQPAERRPAPPASNSQGIEGLDVELGIGPGPSAAAAPRSRGLTAPPPPPNAAPRTSGISLPPTTPGVDDMIKRLNAALHQLNAQLNDVAAKQVRDEQVLRKLLAILIEKGVCTREELQAWLAAQ